MNAAPLGSVARAEAFDEAREIRSILEADRLALEAAITAITRAHVDQAGSEMCPTCRSPRVGSFRYCRSCGHDFEPDAPERHSSIQPRIVR